MKVFFSHSGSRSRELAEALSKFIRKLVPAVEPFISTGMPKGRRWTAELAGELEVAKSGVVCLTSHNLAEPWLVFEAGALSARLNANVCTFLLDVDPTDVQLPLGQFQHTVANSEDVLKLVETINVRVGEVGELQRPLEDLREQFEMLWPSLQTGLAQLKAKQPAAATRDPNAMLSEILDTVRSLAAEHTRSTISDVERAQVILTEALYEHFRAEPLLALANLKAESKAPYWMHFREALHELQKFDRHRPLKWSAQAKKVADKLSSSDNGEPNAKGSQNE